MLQLSGLGLGSAAYNSCMVDYADPTFCGEYYGGPAPGPTISATSNPVQSQTSSICDTCGTDKWCDGRQCIPFTAAEQAEWEQAGKLPPLAVARPKTSLIPGIRNRTLAIGAGLAVAAFLLLR